MIDEQDIVLTNEDERVVSQDRTIYDDVENILRPKSMENYVGQNKVKDNLNIFITVHRDLVKLRLPTLLQMKCLLK